MIVLKTDLQSPLSLFSQYVQGILRAFFNFTRIYIILFTKRIINVFAQELFLSSKLLVYI